MKTFAAALTAAFLWTGIASAQTDDETLATFSNQVAACQAAYQTAYRLNTIIMSSISNLTGEDMPQPRRDVFAEFLSILERSNGILVAQSKIFDQIYIANVREMPDGRTVYEGKNKIATANGDALLKVLGQASMTYPAMAHYRTVLSRELASCGNFLKALSEQMEDKE